MSIQHVDIQDPNIHEPKGITSAAAGNVYVADGSGSGSWGPVGATSIDEDELKTIIQDMVDDGDLTVTTTFALLVVIDDVSTAETVYVPVPVDCTILGAGLVLGAAITGADATISFKDASGASLGTNVTIAQTGSAAGDAYAFTATTNTNLTGPTYIQIATDGASTNTAKLFITVIFQR